jgi:lysozyme family protein
MRENFDRALKEVLKHEGGFVNDPRDSGGMTNLGVTKAVWDKYVGYTSSESEMRALTPEVVAPLYKAQYWGNIGDELPKGVDYLYFDFAVNAGPSRAAKTLQAALGVIQDGVIGPNTLRAIKEADPVKLIDKFTDAKEAFYKSLKTFSVFGRGWLNRCNDSKKEALKMINNV